ncbi:hypothetical protein IT407_01265 [Candidatus Uhrbacteria bacterium]|nr:hypothetical protein [Candidatus Uhrbacteria bacterium]
MYLRQFVLGLLVLLIVTGCGPSDPPDEIPDLTVSLSVGTPSGSTVPANASSVRMALFVFEAGRRSIQLEGLQLRHIGVGSFADLQNVYLYDFYTGLRLTPGRAVDASTGNVQFYLPMEADRTIPAESSRTFMIVADFDAASLGGQHGFELVAATAIHSSDAPAIEGEFPLTASLFTVGMPGPRIDVRSGAAPADPSIGSTDVEISSFTLTASDRAVDLAHITVSETGSIAAEDLTDLRLYVGTELVSSDMDVDPLYNHIAFGFPVPFRLEADAPIEFSVRATVGGPPGRIIRTCIEYPVDVYAVDAETGGEAAVCISPLADGGCSAPGQGSFNGTVPGTYISVTTR